MKLNKLMETFGYDENIIEWEKMYSFPKDYEYNRHIKGNFDCDEIGLTSLQYGPTSTDVDFSCSRNKLKSLKYGPTIVGRSYYCIGFGTEEDTLTSLEGAPRRLEHDSFQISKNSKLSSLEFIPEYIHYKCILDRCGFSSLKGIHKHLKYCEVIHINELKKLKSHLLGLLKIEGLRFAMADVDDPYNKAVKIINRYLKQPMSDERLESCREELIDNNLEEYALE